MVYEMSMEEEYVAMLMGGFISAASAFYMANYSKMCHNTISGFIKNYGKKQRKDTTYLYMITFTIDPKKHPNPDYEKIEKYIERVPKRKALHAQVCEYVKETHKDGRFHYHMKLQTSKWLRSDAFSQYQKIYGNVDVSRSKTSDPSYMDLYMYKESVPKKLL